MLKLCETIQWNKVLYSSDTVLQTGNGNGQFAMRKKYMSSSEALAQKRKKRHNEQRKKMT